jgi:hypothetical protein
MPEGEEQRRQLWRRVAFERGEKVVESHCATLPQGLSLFNAPLTGCADLMEKELA